MASAGPTNKKIKIGSVSEGEDEGNEKGHVKNALQEIKLCQVELGKLNEKDSEEILQIEQKYNQLRKPFYRQRNESFKKLPKFWATAMYHHPFLQTIIQKDELDCLGYMNDCVAEEFDDIKLGYEISFYFDENPYFKNSVLTKTMHLASSVNAKSESTPIQWKEGKDLVEKYRTEVQNQQKRRRRQPLTFFTWFLANCGQAGDEVAETIKEDLWPSALQYYLDPMYGDQIGAFGGEEDDEFGDEDGSDEGDSEMEENMMAGAKFDAIAEEELAGSMMNDYSQSPDGSSDENVESDDESGKEGQSTEETNDEEKT